MMRIFLVSKACAFLSIALALCGCDIRVQELPVAKKLEESCSKYVQAGSEQPGQAAIGRLNAMDFTCIPPVLDSLASNPYDAKVAHAAIAFLDRLGWRQEGTTDPGKSLAALAALTYLAQNAGKDDALGFRLGAYLEPIRTHVSSGLGDVGVRATNLLSIIKDDRDVKLFSKNALSDDDALLAVSLFALAHNCSEVATGELRSLLSSSRVVAYLKKYEGKESITRTVARDCPSAKRNY